eukprot:8164269-Prorocentrum_lima.AAC.1
MAADGGGAGRVGGGAVGGRRAAEAGEEGGGAAERGRPSVLEREVRVEEGRRRTSSPLRRLMCAFALSSRGT